MLPAEIVKLIEKQEVKFVDFRFTDTIGKEHHLSFPAASITLDVFETGKAFDGSSIRGWQAINESDLLLIPDPNTALKDPFSEHVTLMLRCDVVDPATGKPYGRDPRALAKRAEAYLKSTGIADKVYFGPEAEFFIFDSVRWDNGSDGAFYHIDSTEAPWNTGREFENGNMGHRPTLKGGYFPVPPVDSSSDLRAEMCLALEELGLEVEVHHHEVGGCNQNEIGTKFRELSRKADEMQLFKYGVHNVAHLYGKTATFMPKPVLGDNGSGMHCHQSLEKNGQNIFAGEQYAGLSDTALYYIGGIIKHARALNAFTNPATNSYKRLVPGFEAPVLLAYSSRNRSAAIRIPYVNTPKAQRIEVRFPDPMANPYLAFAAMLMAGIDGIRNKIHPGEAMEKDLYDLSSEELIDVPTVCGSLDQALQYLKQDKQFLLEGGVFTDDLIQAYIALKQEDIDRWRGAPHPIEFAMYYSL